MTQMNTSILAPQFARLWCAYCKDLDIDDPHEFRVGIGRILKGCPEAKDVVSTVATSLTHGERRQVEHYVMACV